MAKWKEIYATVKANYSGKEQDRSMYLCKVPSNSIFYSNNILKDIYERLYDHIGGNGFTWNYVQYKNSSLNEDIETKFVGNFKNFIKLTEAGALYVNLSVDKVNHFIDAKINPKTYSIELDEYIKANLGMPLEKHVYATDFLQNNAAELNKYLDEVLEKANDCVIQFYHKYMNKTTEFEINYMDIMDNTRQHLAACGLGWQVGDTEKHGKKFDISIDDDVDMTIKTDPCQIDMHSGRAKDILNLIMNKDARGQIFFNSADDMFKFINMFADMYKAYKDAMATTFKGILDVFKPVEA